MTTMLAVERWEVIYGDGSRFTSDDGTWAEAPPFGVYAIVYYRVDGTRLVHMEQNDDSQYRWPTEYVPIPPGAVEAEFVEAAGHTVKYGLWVDNDQYFALFDAVHGEVRP